MAVEHACTRAVPKPWGVEDLRPWSTAGHGSGAIGEIWYERPGTSLPVPSLLLKLLFTNQPLSIQVHPGDALAHSMGLPNGKSEAWYVLRAAAEAKVALGLDRHLTAQQLRAAIGDGSISALVQWRTVAPGDTIFIPAGTIHAIGAGLVIAEIQQRSDATFRMFDHGREREIHIEHAISAADAGPAGLQIMPSRLTRARTLLASNAHFVLERFDLAAGTDWWLEAERETWLFVLSGDARIGPLDLGIGDAIFAQAEGVDVCTGPTGMVGLVAYTGGDPDLHLLRPARQLGATLPSSLEAT
jgi:mannose-6-phosphate isomerase